MGQKERGGGWLWAGEGGQQAGRGEGRQLREEKG